MSWWNCDTCGKRLNESEYERHACARPAPTPERPATEEGEEEPDMIEALGKILDECGMQVTFTGWKKELEACEAQLAAKDKVLSDVEVLLAAAQERNANLLRDLDTLSVEHGKEMEKMRELLRVAEDALCKIAWRPLTDDFAYCINKKLWINDMEAETAREALARLRSGKDGGKKDG